MLTALQTRYKTNLSETILPSVADPDPACHFDADPDPTFHFDAVTDLDPSFQIKPQNLKKCSNGSFFIHFGLASAY
jgi:hypothetical protein